MKGSTAEQQQLDANYLWIVAAGMPFLFQLPVSAVPVWAIGLIVGGFIAHKHVLRWIALAWGAAIFFPLMPLLLLASCGALIKDWRQCLYAAVLGSALAVVPIPGEFHTAGMLMILMALLLMIYKKVI